MNLRFQFALNALACRLDTLGAAHKTNLYRQQTGRLPDKLFWLKGQAG
jgi:hypothetical protein